MNEMADALRRAKEIVEEAGLDPSSAVGVAAFTEILGRLLKSQRLTDVEERGVDARSEASSDDDSPSARIADWLDVPRDRVEDVIEFDDSGVDVVLHTRSLPQTKADRQRRLSLFKLALEKIAYNRSEVPARELNKVCDRYNCLDQNLPAHLKNYENFITRRGQRGTYVYRISQFGIDEAREGLRALLNAT